jgi:hypothetical protein
MLPWPSRRFVPANIITAGSVAPAGLTVITPELTRSSEIRTVESATTLSRPKVATPSSVVSVPGMVCVRPIPAVSMLPPLITGPSRRTVPPSARIEAPRSCVICTALKSMTPPPVARKTPLLVLGRQESSSTWPG